jgi:myo-inositol-1(or 4)-monophosphatase
MIHKLERILKDVSKDILDNRNFISTYKDKDIVTNNDVEAERRIIKEIKTFRPNDCFISEEENQNQLTNQATWIIDPIDGTLNYTRNIPQYGIQLALYVNSQPQISMMYFPEQDILIHAIKGQGCFINHDKVKIEAMALDQSIVTFGDFSKSQPSSRPKQIELMSSLMDQVMKIRIYGASSSDFSYLILNRSQCHIIFTKRLWELAPGLLLASEAGLSIKPLEFETCKGYMIGHESILNNLENIIKKKD